MNREGAILRNAGLSPRFMEPLCSAGLLRSSRCCFFWVGVRPLQEVKQENAACQTLPLAAQVFLQSTVSPS